MRKTLASLALFVSACASSSAHIAQPANATCAGAAAFVHATVLPMTNVSALNDQTVIVAGDRIVRIGASARVRPPRSACIVDATGRFLMPGLADAHVHLFDDGDLALNLRFGVTSVLNMSGSHMHLRLRDQLRSGAIDGPMLYTTGPMLKIDASPLVEFEQTVASAEEAAPMISSYHAAGYDFVKVWGAFQPPVYDAIASAARAERMRITGHIPRAVGLEGVLGAGQTSFAHVEELLNKHFRGIPTAAQIDETAARLAHAGATLTTTLVTYEAIAADNAVDPAPLLSRPGAEYMDPVRLAMWALGANRLRRAENDPMRIMRSLAAMQAITTGLYKAGVPLLAGTDAGELPGLVPGYDLHRELELIVASGVPAEAALRAATANFGAYMAEKGDRFGVVAVGARADLLLLDADPRADITNTRAIRGVMARGAYYDRVALDALVTGLQSRNRRTGEYIAAVSSGLEQGAAVIARQDGGPALTPVLFMALGLAQRRDFAGAEGLLRQLATVYPDRGEPWFIIAGLHRVAGDTPGAIAALDEVLRRAPDHDRARRDRAQLQRATQ